MSRSLYVSRFHKDKPEQNFQFWDGSNHVTGPFTGRKAIHSIDEAKADHHYPFFYAAIAQPELINEKNELLITYSINDYGPCLRSCPNGRLNPDHLRELMSKICLNYIAFFISTTK